MLSTDAKFVIEAPALEPSVRPTLLDVVNVIPAASPTLYVASKYEPVLQGVNRRVPAEGTDKVFDTEPADNETILFQQYRGVDVSLLRGPGYGSDLLAQVFADGESYAVEDILQEALLNPKAVDITPTTGTKVTNLKYAVALLEQYMADRYTGRPVISGNLVAVGLIPELTARPLATVAGTPIAIAAGYDATGPGGAVAPAGSAWLYISGQINIWKGSPEILSGPNLQANRELTLAEAAYAASVDGPVAAILVGI